MRIARGDEADAVDGAIVVEEPPAAPIGIPYGFARRHGLLPTAESDGMLEVAMRAGADPKALIELRRFLARPFAVREVDAPPSTAPALRSLPLGTEAAADAAARSASTTISATSAALPSAEDLLDTSETRRRSA